MSKQAVMSSEGATHTLSDVEVGDDCATISLGSACTIDIADNETRQQQQVYHRGGRTIKKSRKLVENLHDLPSYEEGSCSSDSDRSYESVGERSEEFKKKLRHDV